VVSEVDFAELLERDQTVIKLPTESYARVMDRSSDVTPVDQHAPSGETPMTESEPAVESVETGDDESEENETIIMDNGSIRTFNSDRFRVPTFVRKQID
jgi:hypothetical protein